MLMNGNIDDPLTRDPATGKLVMQGRLVGPTPQACQVPVRIEVKLLSAAGKVLEKCDSNGDTFMAAASPGSRWSMSKSADKVAQGATVTAHVTAVDHDGTTQGEWESQVTIA
jgi:hypothetical protein